MAKSTYTAKFKSDRVLEVLSGEETLGAIAARHNLNPNVLRNWKKEFLEKAPQLFDGANQKRGLAAAEREKEAAYEELLKTVGQLTIERDWLKKNQSKCLGLITKKSLVSAHSDLSIERQCELLGLNKSSFYYRPVEKSPDQLQREDVIRAAIDRWHTKMPYLGCRRLVVKLTDEGLKTNRKEIKRFMDEMGIYAIYPKPNLSRRNKQHKIYPYLLRNKPIFLPNQVWAIDITYIKMKNGHMYLTAIIDWHSRFIVGWALSDTLDTSPVLDAMKKAIEEYGTPGIANSDQGSQFTSEEYTIFLKEQGIRQSMDGKARWIDNVIIERWFRSLKWDDIYINEYNSPRELRRGIAAYVRDYNKLRPHQSLDYRTPAEAYNSTFQAKQKRTA